MRTLLDQLSNYADYHRSARNIATHLVGVPMIVLAIAALLSRPVWMVGALPASPAVIVTSAMLVFYWRMDTVFGLIMTVMYGLALWFGAWAASLQTAHWLAVGLGSFVIGWVIQFVGHYFEGRKPAFFDDVAGLAIGPLFVVAEVLFKLGAFAALKQAIEQRSGPVRP